MLSNDAFSARWRLELFVGLSLKVARELVPSVSRARVLHTLTTLAAEPQQRVLVVLAAALEEEGARRSESARPARSRNLRLVPSR